MLFLSLKSFFFLLLNREEQDEQLQELLTIYLLENIKLQRSVNTATIVINILYCLLLLLYCDNWC